MPNIVNYKSVSMGDMSSPVTDILIEKVDIFIRFVQTITQDFYPVRSLFRISYFSLNMEHGDDILFITAMYLYR